MERHKCRICYRKFANGRALGGHMRSHMVNLPIPPKPTSCETESWNELSSSSSSSSSSEDEDLGEIEKGLVAADYKLRENPKNCSKIVDVEFSSLGSSSISVSLQEERGRDLERDSGSESESSKNNPTTRKGGMIVLKKRKNPTSTTETTSSMSPASSMSDVTSEEDVALCLMMLSRDNWVSGAGAGAGGRDRFKCYTCDKVFRSYQALGGHRASHNKHRPPASAPAEPGSDPVKQFKVHECPVCFRVFASAQALGGHKRAHSVNTQYGSHLNRMESDTEAGSLIRVKKNTKSKKLNRIRSRKDVNFKRSNACRLNGVGEGTKVSSLIHTEIDTNSERSNEVTRRDNWERSDRSRLSGVREGTKVVNRIHTAIDLHESPRKMMMVMMREDSMIDLNLPASVDQDDEISQVSFSAVSDLHFS